MIDNIIEYLPPVMQDCTEMKHIMNSETPEFRQIWDHLDELHREQYIESMSEYGTKRWEKIISISSKETELLDERKFRISARLNENLPHTYRRLSEQLFILCGKDGYSMQENNFELNVQVALSAKNKFDTIAELLNRVTPIVILINLTLKYNQHKYFEGFTYQQLEKYKHEELKSEVITIEQNG